LKIVARDKVAARVVKDGRIMGPVPVCGITKETPGFFSRSYSFRTSSMLDMFTGILESLNNAAVIRWRGGLYLVDHAGIA
jgi:pseudouridine-5'-phosphate glycosidase